MTQIRSRRPVLAVLVGTALLPVLLLALSGRHMLMFPPALHLVLVGTAGALAAVAAITMSVVAARRHDGRAIIVGTAFAVMAEMLLVHALATPGQIVGPNGVVQVFGALNLPVGGTILAASGLPNLRRRQRQRRLLLAQLALVAALAVAGTLALLFAERIPVVPNPSSTAAMIIFAVTAGPLALLAWRATHTYLLTHRTADLTVAAGVVWLIAAQYALLHLTMMDAAFWAAHLLEVSGIAMIAIPTALDLRFGVASRALVGDLRAADLVEHEEAFLGGRVRALLVRLAAKDQSTEGHTRRVATLAVAIGERLGLPEGRLRQLALGGLLHDMGKLAVPDHILNKPGRLTEEEFKAIRRHPGAGRALLAELGGFTPLVLELVESHHERLDGAGYPHGTPAAELELEVRILTVADVYDALTADRVYREAWPASRALAMLTDETGSAFDADCVAALCDVVAATAPRVPAVPLIAPAVGIVPVPG